MAIMRDFKSWTENYLRISNRYHVSMSVSSDFPLIEIIIIGRHKPKKKEKKKLKMIKND